MAFVIKTEERAAEGDLPHRVLAWNGEGVLWFTFPYNEDLPEDWNHRWAALEALMSSSGIPGYTPHRAIGTAPLGGTPYWVTMIEEAA